ncbi:ammonia monooxygenase [Zymomonas mobilis subsp. pomaceae]|nr:ammonia monooxygenase [Zymomonas mobilis subsp. pomaceae]
MFITFLEIIHLSAALLLGAMCAAILVAVMEGSIRVPRWPFMLAQGVVGSMIARSMPLPIIKEMMQEWPLFISGVFSVIVASSFLGWLLVRWRVVPGTTALWGSSPGAALTMTLMAEAYGADVRLVAFMQYLRVVCVAVVASFVAQIWIGGNHAPPAIVWFPSLRILPFLETLMLIGITTPLARILRIPAGAILLPLGLGVLLQDTGWLSIELPPWLLAISYAFVGWSIGLRFSRAIVLYAARSFPRILGSILTLILLCGGLAMILVKIAHVDPLTAYLAASPGGVDSIAIIAASSPVNMPFVMGMQTVRFIVVLLTAPTIAKFLSQRK